MLEQPANQSDQQNQQQKPTFWERIQFGGSFVKDTARQGVKLGVAQLQNLREAVVKLATDPEIPKALLSDIKQALPTLIKNSAFNDSISFWKESQEMRLAGHIELAEKSEKRAREICVKSLLESGVDAIGFTLAMTTPAGKTATILRRVGIAIQLGGLSRFPIDVYKIAAETIVKSKVGVKITDSILKAASEENKAETAKNTSA